MRKKTVVILLLLLVSFPAVKSLLAPGGFTSHDLTHHIIRQIDMHKLLSEGQFPPRWSGELAAGYGYPLFLFNYPLPAVLGEVFHKFGLGFVDSVKAVLLSSMLISVLGMYFFLKTLLKDQIASVLGAVFYLYAPIHLIVVYVSGAPGASLGLVFPPFIFWAITKLWPASRGEQKNTNKFLLLGSVSLAGLILSHNITAFIFMPVILAYVAVLKLLTDKKENPYFLASTVLMFLMGLGLSAWFWLPAMSEKQFIRYDQLMRRIYVDQFPTLSQIIYSPWGYGLSHPQKPEPGDMSYQIGLTHLLVVLVLVGLIWFMRKKKIFLYLGIFIILLFIASIFFMLEQSMFWWDRLPFLSYIQFPVRILIVPVFVSSLGAALLVKYLPGRKILFFGLLFLVLYANRNHLRINQKYDPGEDYYLSLKTSTTSFDENLPIWVTKIKTDADHGKFSFLSGKGTVNTIESKSARVLAEVEATESAEVRFNQYYFPGWDIEMDGEKVNFNYLTADNSGLPVFDMEKGKHLVKAEFKNTPIRNLADAISLASVIIWLVLLCRLLILH